ncbi:MAG: transcription-repair coupling factor [Paludibacteraceae bacterium]|nr:transcription-repair coupling factor [Paludibacteraceae bacterium]
MRLYELKDLIGLHPEIDATVAELGKGKEKHLLLTGLNASARSIVLAAIMDKLGGGSARTDGKSVRTGRNMLVLLDSQDEAQYMYADLQALAGERVSEKGKEKETEKGIGEGDQRETKTGKVQVLFFPNSRRRRQGADEAMIIQRTEVLTALSAESERPRIVVSYPEAIAEGVAKREQLEQKTIRLHVEQTMPISRLTEMLHEQGFERMDFVYEPGQYAVRGGIVDVYSYSHDDPYRIDYWGDEIESIRTFDIETQLSQQQVREIDIIARQQTEKDETASLTEYLGKDTIWVSNDFSVVDYKLKTQDVADCRLPDLKNDGLTTIEIGHKSYYERHTTVAWNTLPQPVFHKNFELLIDDLVEKQKAGFHLYILSDQKKQTDRLAAIFEQMGEDGGEQIRFTAVDKTLHAGFVDQTMRLACYTDHEIFERFHRVSLRSENARRGKAIVTLREINQLQVGDYVVHSDHGVGRFGGLVTTTVNGKPQEMIKLIFRDGDTIFVSIHNLHRISKYKGREGSEPTISKLGSGAWERLKERTKDKVKDIARDLIRLYATRKQQPGHCYSPDGYMQHELEASFLYEDTPDQAKATLDVKHDMESRRPMDRLICGDVGFGKTEVAMRAAFKAATDGKQTAVLVPTTVLALQHYQSFRERMKGFPVTIEYLSRGKTAKEQKEILDRLKEGKIDILIGTHKLVSKSVVWKDLGLLIIDEEQKFGVAVKEKLKNLRANVDVLTLTATPIPRTLQFSLLGARDLSIINTPPPNRYPIQTEVITPEDEDIIKEAIDLEMERNGQVFVVNNRIEMLERIQNRLQRLCPQARIVVAHGQMPTDEMEKRLEDFINYEYDVLIATTIIESGVDIPNVNTMIIYSAQHYGLSDLHQLRGRVGRSNRKAYCYLVAPERELLTADARRRLDAISTFAELGSGFNLAMQDLDIRGAGNLLGAEQSGFIADLGYETYQRILNEAVAELKEEMGMEAMDEREWKTDNRHRWAEDCQLESDLQLGFPTNYVENISERISLYRELDQMRDEEQLLAYKKRLIDRFGNLPESAEELLDVVRLRWLCCELGIEKVFLKGERLVLYFTTKKPRYWQSDTFQKFITYATTRPERCMLKEDVDKKGQPTGRRYMTIQNVRTVAGALRLLNKLRVES